MDSKSTSHPELENDIKEEAMDPGSISSTLTSMGF